MLEIVKKNPQLRRSYTIYIREMEQLRNVNDQKKNISTSQECSISPTEHANAIIYYLIIVYHCCYARVSIYFLLYWEGGGVGVFFACVISAIVALVAVHSISHRCVLWCIRIAINTFAGEMTNAEFAFRKLTLQRIDNYYGLILLRGKKRVSRIPHGRRYRLTDNDSHSVEASSPANFSLMLHLFLSNKLPHTTHKIRIYKFASLLNNKYFSREKLANQKYNSLLKFYIKSEIKFGPRCNITHFCIKCLVFFSDIKINFVLFLEWNSALHLVEQLTPVY